MDGPFLVFLSLLGVGKLRLAVNQKFAWPGDEKAFDRADMLFPDLLLDEAEAKSAEVLRPAFDILWQAAGFERCLDYDEETGEWIPPGGSSLP